MTPTLFIGSSSESIPIAYAAQRNLEDVAEVVVWTQGIFELNKSYLESLIDALDDTQFGLFVFGPDDVTKIRGVETATTRDNVIFELGLFIGRLGRERSFIIAPRDVADFRMPSDLLGIHAATFQAPSRPDRWRAALGPACQEVRTAIQRQARAEAAALPQPDQIGLLLPLVIPESERRHLLNLAHGKTGGYKGRGSLRSELRHLRSMGLIQKRSGRNIGALESGAIHDIADFVELTELGRQLAQKLEI